MVFKQENLGNISVKWDNHSRHDGTNQLWIVILWVCLKTVYHKSSGWTPHFPTSMLNGCNFGTSCIFCTPPTEFLGKSLNCLVKSTFTNLVSWNVRPSRIIPRDFSKWDRWDLPRRTFFSQRPKDAEIASNHNYLRIAVYPFTALLFPLAAVMLLYIKFWWLNPPLVRSVLIPASTEEKVARESEGGALRKWLENPEWRPATIEPWCRSLPWHLRDDFIILKHHNFAPFCSRNFVLASWPRLSLASAPVQLWPFGSALFAIRDAIYSGPKKPNTSIAIWG